MCKLAVRFLHLNVSVYRCCIGFHMFCVGVYRFHTGVYRLSIGVDRFSVGVDMFYGDSRLRLSHTYLESDVRFA